MKIRFRQGSCASAATVAFLAALVAVPAAHAADTSTFQGLGNLPEPQTLVNKLPTPLNNFLHELGGLGQDVSKHISGVEFDLKNPKPFFNGIKERTNKFVASPVGGAAMKAVRFLADFTVMILTGIVEILRKGLSYL